MQWRRRGSRRLHLNLRRSLNAPPQRSASHFPLADIRGHHCVWNPTRYDTAVSEEREAKEEPLFAVRVSAATML